MNMARMRVPLDLLSAAFAVLSFACVAQATTKYVTPDGAGLVDGSTWGNAYSNVQDAVDACPADGDAVYIKYGVYTNLSEITVSDHPGLMICGGYLGVGAPGAFTNDATVLTRDPSVPSRIVYASLSTVTVDRVTIKGGEAGQAVYGAGLHLTNCTTVVTNCIITDNTIPGSGGYALYKGGGIYAMDGSLTVVDSLLRDNGYSLSGGSTKRQGGGLYAENLTLTLTDVTLSGNRVGANDPQAGGGIYLSGGSASISDCTFNTNYIDHGWNGSGGAIYALGASSLTITNSAFRGNRIASTSIYGAYGGAIYAQNCSAVAIVGCLFDGHYLQTNSDTHDKFGRALYLLGTTSGTIADCEFLGVVSGNGVPDEIAVNISSPHRVVIRNAALRGGARGYGIRKWGTGTLSLTNCLINFYDDTGVKADAGTVSMANCTVADNGGWGLTNAAATVTVVDSVVWDNTTGGLSTNGGDTVTYSCSQELHTGTGNQNTDPLFVGGYYLSVDGLPTQDADSPCIDAGSDTAAALGLSGQTTRTDASLDVDAVDLGYHVTNGFSFANLTLYVNASSPGNDANAGTNAATAFKTITKALSVSILGSTIHIAPGLYDQTVNGESFPLVSQEANLTLKGTDRTATVIDAGATGRVFSADGGGTIWLESLTFTNGSASTGAGIYLPGCQTTITNCTIVGNRIPGSPGTFKGGGIYALSGSLAVIDSQVRDNGYSTSQQGNRYGGGLCAENVDVTLKGATFDSNFVGFRDGGYGGGVYLSGGSASLIDCAFNTNSMPIGYLKTGVALNAAGVIPLTISNCVFTGNSISSGATYGRGTALYIIGGSQFTISGCQFQGNSLSANNTARGSALFVSGASGAVVDCTIEGHTSGNGSDTIYVDNTAPSVVSMQRVSMKGALGDGVTKVGTGALGITNSLIYAFPGDGIQVDAGTVTLVNSTLVDNGGWGVTNASGVVTSRNCIAWGNTTGGFTTNCSLTYTDSQEVHAGDGNTNIDPLFVDASTNNYHLTEASPCVGTGTNETWMIAAVDLDGNDRIKGSRVDMGVYEVMPPSGTLITIR